MWRASNRTSYYLSEISMNLRAAYGSSVSAIFTIAIAVTIFGGFWTLERTLARLAEDWQNQAPMVLFLSDALSDEALESMQQRLRRLPGVVDLEFISKQAAREEFLPNLAPAAGILAELGDNPLPASLVVRYNQRLPGARELAALKAEVAGWSGVEEAAFSSETGVQLARLRRRINYMASVLGGLLALGLLVVVVNTVRLTIEARGDEIAIMSLVGASNTFIRLPLLCEGVLQAVAGAVLAGGILYGLGEAWPQQLFPLLPQAVGDAPVIFLLPRQLLTMVGATALLGLLGSFVAVRRYLKA